MGFKWDLFIEDLVSLQNLGVAKELLIFEIFFEFSFCDVFLTKFLFKLSTYPSK